MKYCNKEDLFIRFGKTNIVEYADVENTQQDDIIDERIEWAIEQATEEINERLRESPYSFPLQDDIPLSIKKVCSEISTIYLYDSRRINDSDDAIDELNAIRTAIEEYFRLVCGGKRILSLKKNDNIPFVVNKLNENNDCDKWFCKK